MVTMLTITVPQAYRAHAATALKELDCEIEAQGYADGSTSWRFIAACFIPHIDSGKFQTLLREQMHGYAGWLNVSPWNNID
jgi:hypothetical protein